MSAQQSLEMYPVGGAMTMEEDRKGRLLPGMLADIAALDGDPVDAAPGGTAKYPVHHDRTGRATCLRGVTRRVPDEYTYIAAG